MLENHLGAGVELLKACGGYLRPHPWPHPCPPPPRPCSILKAYIPCTLMRDLLALFNIFALYAYQKRKKKWVPFVCFLPIEINFPIHAPKTKFLLCHYLDVIIMSMLKFGTPLHKSKYLLRESSENHRTSHVWILHCWIKKDAFWAK